MKKIIMAWLTASVLLCGVIAQALAEEGVYPPIVSPHSSASYSNLGGIGGVASLRGLTEIEVTRPADNFKVYPRDHHLETSYVYQPPLVPHTIRNYEVSLNVNKCLSCHSWKNAKDMGATKISVTHYVNRQEQVLSDVSPRRYFCLQCHVPQADAQPLVDSTFLSVDSLRK